MIASIRKFFDIQILRNENQQLKEALTLAYRSSNFNCYNRSGGEVHGADIIRRERRRCSSGELHMICLDIAGLGVMNQRIGEPAVNLKVSECLQAVQAMRGVELVAQLNSGDEFTLLVDSVDAEGVVSRARGLFIASGFDGLYAAVGAIDPEKSYVQNADCLMKSVYFSKSA